MSVAEDLATDAAAEATRLVAAAGATMTAAVDAVLALSQLDPAAARPLARALETSASYLKRATEQLRSSAAFDRARADATTPIGRLVRRAKPAAA